MLASTHYDMDKKRTTFRRKLFLGEKFCVAIQILIMFSPKYPTDKQVSMR